MKVAGVLLDLDGTLVDTAPDLVAVLNALLLEQGEVRVPYAIARNEVSNGALGLIRLGFGDRLDTEQLEELRQRFLERYRERVCIQSRLFIDLNNFFKLLPDFRHGIVTNKPEALTLPLLEQLGIARCWGTIVSGDRLPQRKPDPAPLHIAAEELGLESPQCIYIGDARRDIEAGRAAGMATVIAAFGYIRPGDRPESWGADIMVRHPAELVDAVRRLGRGRNA